MNSLPAEDRANVFSEDIPAAIPSLIDAAASTFDADRDIARRYLLRASALMRIKGRVSGNVKIKGGAQSRGGLMTWQVNRAVTHIEAHLAEKITAEALAHLLHLSVGQMFRAFKVSLGISPFQYITRCRVELACTLMTAATEPLSQIAVACGLCDQSHFCRVFRRVTGMSPSGWRRSLLAPERVDSGIMDVTSATAGRPRSASRRDSAR